VIPAGQAMITTAELAVELDVDPDTVSRWARTRLRFAKYSRGIFLVSKLRALGILPPVEPQAPQRAASDFGGLVVVTVEELRRIVREEVAKAVAS